MAPHTVEQKTKEKAMSHERWRNLPNERMIAVARSPGIVVWYKKLSIAATVGCPEMTPISQGALKPSNESERASALSINGLSARSPAKVAINTIRPLQEIAATTPGAHSNSGVLFRSLIA
jgi:hypothetical protein